MEFTTQKQVVALCPVVAVCTTSIRPMVPTATLLKKPLEPNCTLIRLKILWHLCLNPAPLTWLLTLRCKVDFYTKITRTAGKDLKNISNEKYNFDSWSFGDWVSLCTGSGF